jgi:hypothetical protein
MGDERARVAELLKKKPAVGPPAFQLTMTLNRRRQIVEYPA